MQELNLFLIAIFWKNIRNSRIVKLEENDEYSRTQPKPQEGWRPILGSYPHAIVIRNAQTPPSKGGLLNFYWTRSSLRRFEFHLWVIEKPNLGGLGVESEPKALEKRELCVSNNRAESVTLVQGHTLGFTVHKVTRGDYQLTKAARLVLKLCIQGVFTGFFEESTYVCVCEPCRNLCRTPPTSTATTACVHTARPATWRPGCRAASPTSPPSTTTLWLCSATVPPAPRRTRSARRSEGLDAASGACTALRRRVLLILWTYIIQLWIKWCSQGRWVSVGFPAGKL